MIIQTTGFVGYNVLDQPSRVIDCSLAPQACQISGEDSAVLMILCIGEEPSTFSTQFGRFESWAHLSYVWFFVSTIPESDSDPYASEYAQSGKQVGAQFMEQATF